MMRVVFPVLIVAVVCVAIAGVRAEDKPAESPSLKSMAARNALSKYQTAVDEAESACQHSIDEAKRKMCTDLRKAQQAAMKMNDQEEVLAIASKLKRTEDELDHRTAVTRPDAAIVGHWRYSTDAEAIIQYTPDGNVLCNKWNGAQCKWRQIDAHTFGQQEKPGEVTITVTSDGKHALWIYPNSRVCWATRVPAP